MMRPRVLQTLASNAASGISLVLLSGRRYAIQETLTDGRIRVGKGYNNLGVAIAQYRRTTGDYSSEI
jgi:hypothetical protein